MGQRYGAIIFSTYIALSLPGCQYLREVFGPVLQQPQVSVKDIQISSINLVEIKLKVRFLVQNPNSFSLEFSNLNYEIILGKRRVASGIYPDKFKLPEEDNTIIDIPLSIANAEAAQILREISRKNRTLRLELKGAVDFHSSFGAMTITFKHEKDLFER